MIILTLFLILIQLYSSLGKINSNQKQPKIVSIDGHLTFIAAADRNISFQTQAGGGIHINGQDLLATLHKANNATFHQNLNLVQSTYSEFKDKVIALEIKSMDFDNYVSTSNTSLSLLKASLTVLTRRINVWQRNYRRMLLILRQNECLSNPCKHNGICQDLYGGYYCVCPEEWEGTNCEKDVNECVTLAGTDLGCQNGATCRNTPGSYTCVCAPGWYGVDCTRRSADCATGGRDLCGHGTCAMSLADSSLKCVCDQGWKTDGVNIACNIDVNECESSQFPCSVSPKVDCINVPGSFRCGPCPMGYTGNGYYCMDVDECAVLNGGCSMSPMVQCINTMGSRICGFCPPGYTGDGAVCSYKGVCDVNNGGCHHLAQCRDNPRISSSYVECICPAGYLGNGIGPNGCTHSNLPLSNPCDANPCVNGVCSVNNITGNYICNCRQRYTGRNCDILKNPCTSNPCLNGGTCTSVIGLTYKCACPSGFIGRSCETEQEACGGFLRADEGTLKYPPDNYNSFNTHVSCAWIIKTTNASKVLNITFTKFNLEQTRACTSDWMQIHDGRNSAAHPIGRYCGKKLPKNGTIISTHDTIYLWFRSGQITAGKGFELSWTSVKPKCFDIRTVKSHGTIQSPGFPGNYPNNRDCIWILIAPAGKRLMFHFFSLMIGNNQNCDKDYLEIVGSATYTSPVSVKYCNTTLPPPFYSVSNFASVHFHSDATKSYQGFSLTYSIVELIPGCGGIYTLARGELQSPGSKGQYLTLINCEYYIRLSKKTRVKLTFVSFNLEPSVDCKFDSVSVYDGKDANAPLLGRYCGTNLPNPIVSNQNELTVVFKSDLSHTGEGFKLQYETICGNKYTKPSGEILSTDYLLRSQTDVVCIYEIIQPLGTIITLNFTEFNVFPVSLNQASKINCNFEYIEVRDGDHENSTLIGRYCTDKPPLITSSNNYLWIKFKSDRVISGRPFRAFYNTTNIGCGGILKEKTGQISVPLLGDSYKSDLKCVWIINAPPKNVIKLTWMMFNLENSFRCSFDHVVVYDENPVAEMGGVIGRYCGQQLPPTLLTSSNTMKIVFQSDKTINKDGFLAFYTFVEEANLCGGSYFTDAGVIKTPGYPNLYPPSSECVWTITVQPGKQILLNFTSFDIESYSNCKYDWLEIRNGGTYASPLIGKFCGRQIPKLIPSHTNKLFLKFNSDSTKNWKGFYLTWSSTATGCGGTLSSPSGTIISPHYPEPYSRNTVCIWKISINPGSLIQVIFSDLELEKQHKCLLDYVEIFDGIQSNSKSLGRFCTMDTANIITSTSNHLLVKFRSDVNLQGRGFQLQYSTICNNKLKGFNGVIESPNFPNGYPHKMNCAWEIAVPPMNKIKIYFSHFNLERALGPRINDSDQCKYDYVQIKKAESAEAYDSNSEDYDIGQSNEIKYSIYGTYCGSENPGLILVDSNIAIIHFVSDDLLTANGFRLEWQLEGCGGILTHSEGSIESPNYPSPYPAGIECHWLIQVDPGKSIAITFGVVEIEKATDCNFDYIDIFNGINETYNHLARICHQTKPIEISSTGNAMFIKFKTDTTYQGRGFYANYTTLDTNCGGTYSHTAGTIYSPNYPKNYNKNETCGWLIDVDEHHVIELEVQDLDLARKSCSVNSIRVYDGPSQGFPVLLEICNNTKPNKTIVSSYNNLFIEFRSTSFLTSKGFRLKYYTACGAKILANKNGIIEHSTNTISSNKYQGNCTFTITAQDPSQHIFLSINKEFSDGYACYDDYKPIVIYNGDSADAPLIGSYCKDVPIFVTSDGASLHIVVGYSYGFFATYVVADSHCGGDISKISGSFTSPGYPKKYPLNMQCEWFINVAEGNHITINFVELDLVQSDGCNTDYLEVRSRNSSGKLIGVYCGNKNGLRIKQMGNIWVMLKTAAYNDQIFNKGFNLEFSLEFNNELYGPSGIIQSPLYPEGTTATTDFKYKITVVWNKKIQITFTDFVMELFYPDGCFSSYINIFDGPDDTAPSLGTYCGLTKPKPITSSSNVIFISAAFSSARTKSIFALEWSTITDRPIIEIGGKNITGCGFNETIDMSNYRNFTITSPGYPTEYPKNIKCEWIFSTISMNHLGVTFYDINLKRRAYCYDYVSIFQKEYNDTDWQLVSKTCELNTTRISTFFSTKSNLLRILFESSFLQGGNGFKASIRKYCGGNMQGPSGYIKFDNTTVRGFQCTWTVSVKTGKTIKLSFLKLDIGSGSSCHNYLLVRNGFSVDSPFLGNGKYCNNEMQRKSLSTTGNKLFVQYKGSSDTQFILKYESVSYACGGQISLSNFDNVTEITSPNYPNIPNSHIECIWVVRAPPGERLRVDFEERFDLTNTEDCSAEYVELRNGGSEYSPLLGRYCKDSPSSQFSTDNIIFIKFFTDTDDPKNGFKAKISISYCGGTIRGQSGVVKSPKISSYPNHLDCLWTIISPSNHYLTISFDKFQLSYGNHCLTDSLTIKEILSADVAEDEDEKEYQLCGSRIPNDITTSSNKVELHLIATFNRFSFEGFSLRFTASVESCGGEINGQDRDVITSPGYPVISALTCIWVVKSPKGTRVTLELNDLDFESTESRAYQGLYLFEEHVLYRNMFPVLPIGHFEYGSEKKILESSSNQMRILYSSLRASSHRGFKATLTYNKPTVCLGDFEQDEGSFTQPINRTRFFCPYTHSAKNTSHTFAISLQMKTKFSKHSSCGYRPSFIYILSDRTRKIFELCSTTTTPVTVLSPWPITRLFSGAHPLYGMNYTVNFKTYNCGGIISAPMGEISSPSYPNKHPTHIECVWLINVAKENTIALRITDFDLGDTCDKSSLNVYNGDTQMNPLIGTYCQKNKPNIILSEFNQLLITYKSDPSSNGKGFALNFEAQANGCGGILHQTNSIIETPNYGKEYPDNAECEWELRADNGYFISLKFLDRFYLEESANCDKDYLEIYDYVVDKWVLLEKVCGRKTPRGYNSTSTRMKLLFRSNDKISASGFKAKWELSCGGSYVPTNEPQYIVSPGYPNDYAKNLYCVYKIESPKRNQMINIEFEDFHLEGEGGNCQFDNVTVVGGLSHRMDALTYCGTRKPPFQRHFQKATITFRSDMHLSRKGFKLKFMNEVCGGNITEETTLNPQVFTNKVNEYHYFNLIHCMWQITAPENKVVLLEIETLEMGRYLQCASNKVDVYEGNKENATNRIAVLCGTINGDIVHSHSNQLLVVLHKNGYYSGRSDTPAFKANIKFVYGPSAGCGDRIFLTETKEIEAPNYPNLDCVWKIGVERDETIEITFNEFNLPPCPYCNSTNITSTNCDYAFIEVHDGASNLADLIEKFCNMTSKEPKTVTTSRNYAYIRLFIKPSVKRAFKLTLTPKKSICGDVIRNVTNSTQILQSPNYPNSYPKDFKCTWIFVPKKPGDIIKLRFTAFDLTDDFDNSVSVNKCVEDKIEIDENTAQNIIKDGLAPNSLNYIGNKKRKVYLFINDYSGKQEHCGKNLQPFTYYSSGKEVVLKMFSGPSGNKGKGFKMDYSVADCSQNYTSEQGRAVNYDVNGDCYLSITSPENTTISVYFIQAFSNPSTNCVDAGIEVRENDHKGKKLLSSCGFVLPSPIFSLTNKIWIHAYKHSKFTLRNRFDFIFTSTDKGQGCGGNLYNYKGVFSSPLYPQPNAKDSLCRWDIRVPIGLKVALKFQIFQLKGHCSDNYVKVTTYNDNVENSVKFCANDNPGTIKSDLKMVLEYQSSASSPDSQWLAYFQGIGSDIEEI